MGDERKQVVTGTVDAPPEQVFAVLSDPANHTGIDGAGMLRGIASSGGPVTGVGDSWVMNMNQSNLGDYQMRSEVIAFEPNRQIAWEPAIHRPTHSPISSETSTSAATTTPGSWRPTPTAAPTSPTPTTGAA